MRLNEVLQILLENKVEYIAKNQGIKLLFSIPDHDPDSVITSIKIASIQSQPNGSEHKSLSPYIIELNHKSWITYEHIKDQLLGYFEHNIDKIEGSVINNGIDISYTEHPFEIDNKNIEAGIESFNQALIQASEKILQFMADNISQKYLQWLVGRYMRGDFNLAEDYEMISETLTLYDEVRKETDIPQLTKKISYQDLYNALEGFRVSEEAEALSAKMKKLVSEGQLEIPFSKGKDEYVAIPKTYEASRFVSEPNGWCTKHENWYESYTRDERILYFFKHESKPYLVEWNSEQFMGKANSPFDPREMAESSEAFEWIVENHYGRVKAGEVNVSVSSFMELLAIMYGETERIEWALQVFQSAENDPPGSDDSFTPDKNFDTWLITALVILMENDASDDEHLDTVLESLGSADKLLDTLRDAEIDHDEVFDKIFSYPKFIKSYISDHPMLSIENEENNTYRMKLYSLDDLVEFVPEGENVSEQFIRDALSGDTMEYFLESNSGLTPTEMMYHFDGETPEMFSKAKEIVYDYVIERMKKDDLPEPKWFINELDHYESPSDIEDIVQISSRDIEDMEDAIEGYHNKFSIEKDVDEIFEIVEDIFSDIATAILGAYERATELASEGEAIKSLDQTLRNNGVLKHGYDSVEKEDGTTKYVPYAIINAELLSAIIQRDEDIVYELDDAIDLEKLKQPYMGWHDTPEFVAFLEDLENELHSYTI